MFKIVNYRFLIAPVASAEQGFKHERQSSPSVVNVEVQIIAFKSIHLYRVNKKFASLRQQSMKAIKDVHRLQLVFNTSIQVKALT